MPEVRSMATREIPLGHQDHREQRRHALHRVLQRTNLLHAAFVGLIASLLGVAYQLAVRVAETASNSIANRAMQTGPIAVALTIAAAAAIGGVTAMLIARHAPESGGSGIPHIKAALLHLRTIRPVKLIVAKFFGGLAALTVGMSLGREGPTVQMGGSVGKLVGDVLRAPKRARGPLIAAGAGAGLAAAFNAPLAGFLFVMEELKREMSALTYGSALAASATAVAVTRYLIGEHPSFVLPSPGSAPLNVLPPAVVLGAIAGVAGVLFNRSLIGALELRRRFRISAWVYGAAVGALAMAAIGFVPQIAGGGHLVAERLLSGGYRSLPLIALVAIFFGKLVLTSLSYGTGVPGGIFAPILVMGAFVGYAFGLAAQALLPGLTFGPAGFATLGMAAMLAGSVRAPLTGVVLIVEMTAEYGLLYALLVSAFIASLVAQALGDEPIYECLMERTLRLSGADVHPEIEPILLEILVEPHSSMDGRRIRHLKLPPGAIVATLERGSRHIVPGGSTLLAAGDMLTVMIEGDKPELSLAIHGAAKAPA